MLEIGYNGTVRYLRHEEIIYIIVSNHNLTFFLENNDQCHIRKSLNSLEQELPDTFCRIHSNCLVNVSKIKEIRKDERIVSFHEGSERNIVEKRINGLIKAYIRSKRK